jgi:hypothetical protein
VADDHFRDLLIAMAAAGAMIALIAAAGKLSGRLADRTVDRLYYVSYGCTGLSILLFVMHGLFVRNP